MIKEAKSKIYILYPARPKDMQGELKIIDSKTCGNVWIGTTGTLYTIQIGDDTKNTRLAFKQFELDNCAWVKEGREKDALKYVKSDPSDDMSLFDANEPRDALIALLTNKKKICSRPDGHAQTDQCFPRKACG